MARWTAIVVFGDGAARRRWPPAEREVCRTEKSPSKILPFVSTVVSVVKTSVPPFPTSIHLGIENQMPLNGWREQQERTRHAPRVHLCPAGFHGGHPALAGSGCALSGAPIQPLGFSA